MMMNSIQAPHSLNPILDLCRQFIPYLDGCFEDPVASSQQQINSNQWLTGRPCDQSTIQALIDDLKSQHPDAGHAYIQARTWHLLCWQPIYIAFISIYGLQRLPDFNHFKQQRQHNAIIGFKFESAEITVDKEEQLISPAAKQLKPLFAHYREQLDSVQRCRPHYANRFVADLILGTLIKVKDVNVHFTDQKILQHAQLWLKHMGLSSTFINSLKIKHNQPISFVRTSCCLADKVNQSLCSDCPKVHKNNNTQKYKAADIQTMVIN